MVQHHRIPNAHLDEMRNRPELSISAFDHAVTPLPFDPVRQVALTNSVRRIVIQPLPSRIAWPNCIACGTLFCTYVGDRQVQRAQNA